MFPCQLYSFICTFIVNISRDDSVCFLFTVFLKNLFNKISDKYDKNFYGNYTDNFFTSNTKLYFEILNDNFGSKVSQNKWIPNYKEANGNMQFYFVFAME